MYVYQTERPKLFTEDGVTKMLAVRDCVYRKIAVAGAVEQSHATDDVSGDGWLLLACLDYLVERGELREITSTSVPGQDRVFVKGPSFKGSPR